MDLVIKINTGKTLKDCAEKIALFNTVAAPLLVNGPIKCNADPSDGKGGPVNEYGYLGDFNTLTNEFNYCTVRISNYRKLLLSADMLGFLADTFVVVVGEPAEDTVDANGNPIVVVGHGIA